MSPASARAVAVSRSPVLLDDYLALKERSRALDPAVADAAESRRDISIQFMKLLSYPEPVIRAKLSGASDDPFMLLSI